MVQEPDGTIVICEVKTRSPRPPGQPRLGRYTGQAAPTDPRRRAYLQQTGLSDAPVRFDVAEVTPLDSGRWMVHIIRVLYSRERSAPVGKCTGRKGFAATSAGALRVPRRKGATTMQFFSTRDQNRKVHLRRPLHRACPMRAVCLFRELSAGGRGRRCVSWIIRQWQLPSSGNI